MGSEGRVSPQAPAVYSIVVGTLSSLMAILGIAPVGIATLDGSFPALVKGSIPSSLALMVCSLFVWASLVLTLIEDGRGLRYHVVGMMLSFMVGSVISLVGVSWMVVELSQGSHLTMQEVLGSGTLPGALLALTAYGGMKRALRKLDRAGAGDEG